MTMAIGYTNSVWLYFVILRPQPKDPLADTSMLADSSLRSE
jgi:hypothetical protein